MSANPHVPASEDQHLACSFVVQMAYHTPIPMKHLALALLFLSCLSAELCARTWTSSDGRKVEAEFVSAIGGTVTLKRSPDGQTFTLPLVRLSAEDQAWIKTAAAAPAQPAVPAPAKAATPSKPLEGPFAKLLTGEWAL